MIVPSWHTAHLQPVTLPEPERERLSQAFRGTRNPNAAEELESLIREIEFALSHYQALRTAKPRAIAQEREFLRHRSRTAEVADAERGERAQALRRAGRRVPMYLSARPYGRTESDRRIKQLSTEKPAERWLVRDLALIFRAHGLPVTATKSSVLIALLAHAFTSARPNRTKLKDNSLQRMIRNTLGRVGRPPRG
jgi:hypothetical protein